VSVDVLFVSVANELGSVCKRAWGRGPEYTQVLPAGEDTVVLLLTRILTDAEHSLLGADRESVVRSMRAVLHEVLEPEIRAILERSIGRRTEAFISGIDVEHDLASIVVTLR
jgi:uncharacterized protein YbcI